jgi:hypothetical protein
MRLNFKVEHYCQRYAGCERIHSSKRKNSVDRPDGVPNESFDFNEQDSARNYPLDRSYYNYDEIPRPYFAESYPYDDDPEIGNQYSEQYQKGRLAREHNRGPHSGRGPKGFKRSDERILENINERLSEDSWLDAYGIEVSINNGEVTLEGTVTDMESKQRAKAIVKTVVGVSKLHNQLRIE